ncbi:heavy-metal-associated domain-containing protein [Pseudobutyrivibrio sp. MD2005]|uniref:heavy-metal-associated domain-containing protein n=1 Tax=Pseudobutyrivibrio sp. MD2005 TaxID=1410616 RepID=UPI0004856AB9|nr:heavy-metal-associated domain-containing protein [Pseudobutyrivibrio sp. MD2005]
MKKYTVKIDGMMCGMCEAHVNDVIRKTIPAAAKVTSSHKKGVATFLAEDIDDDKLIAAVADTGYTVLDIESEPYVKKFFLFRK